VVTSDHATSEAHIRAHCREYLTAYKQPKIVEFRAVLPRSAVGKILRQELVAPCAA
jgi:long-chain acyl-CoA synthetase